MKLFKIIKLSLIALLISVVAMANSAWAAQGTAEATVVIPLTIEADPGLLIFGGIVSGPAGSVTVAADTGNLSADVTTVVPPTHQRAEFSVTGDNNRTYDITCDPTVTLTGLGDDMIATLVCFSVSDSSATTGTLTAGNDTIWVGGTLPVGLDQTPDAYDGNFDVTVNY